MRRLVGLTLLLSCSLFCSISSYAGEVKREPLVIIGSGPAGWTAAIYAARSGLSCLVLEGSEPGGQIALSHQVENFPGFPKGIGGFELGTEMQEQAVRFGARVQNSRVIKADLTSRPFRLELQGGDTLLADALIVASGASTRWLNLPSEQALIGKGVTSCAVCDGFFFQDQEVVVVGGGNSALDDALFLTTYVSKVTVVHRTEHLRASKCIQERAFANKKIHFVYNSTVEEVLDPAQGKVTGVKIKNQITQKESTIPCTGLFIAIGHIPNTTLFKGALDMDKTGYLITAARSSATNIEGVFAAGDVADPHYQQAITAAGSGCMAAIDAYHFLKQSNTDKGTP